MSIATKTGDNGTSGLMFNRRVSKTDPRIAANGACDELNAALGIARAWNDDPLITQPIFQVQKELVILMGEIACAPEDRERYREKGFQCIEPAMVERLTAHIHDLETNYQISYQHWATPGATKASAFLDQARVIAPSVPCGNCASAPCPSATPSCNTSTASPTSAGSTPATSRQRAKRKTQSRAAVRR